VLRHHPRMTILDVPFQVTDWSMLLATEHPGASGSAHWRTVEVGNVRVRMVEYTPGYVADHWCERGHVLLVLDGELLTELRDGSIHRLGPGQSYEVAEGKEAHRSSSSAGCRLFIVD
jgi:hypothetical protein